MPVYNFVCQQCDKRFEDLVPFSRRDQVHCPTCGGETRVGVSKFAFGGSGGGSGATVSAPAPARGGFS